VLREVESGIPYEIVRELEKRGHEVRFDVGGYGGYQAIKVGCLMAARYTSGQSDRARMVRPQVIQPRNEIASAS